jgi:hypothetical protein
MVFVCAGIETNVGIICGCLPGIKPLLNRMFPKAFASATDSRTFQEFSRRRRLPGARLSIHPPPRVHYHRPSMGSMVEVPIKLDQHWNPLESPVAVPLRSVPGDIRLHQEHERRDVERGLGAIPRHADDHTEDVDHQHPVDDLENQIEIFHLKADASRTSSELAPEAIPLPNTPLSPHHPQPTPHTIDTTTHQTTQHH